MSREKALAKNTLILSIGKFSTQLITFFLLPLYTGKLTTEEYGIVDLVNTLVMLMVPLISLQIEQGAFRMLVDARNTPTKNKVIITNAIASTLLGILVFIIICVPLLAFNKKIYWRLFIFITCITVESTLLLQIARGVEKNIEYAFASFIIALSTIVFNVILIVFLNAGVNGMLMGSFIGQLIGCIYLFRKLDLKKYIYISSLNKKVVDALWRYSIPLVPSSLSWWIFNASDRLIVTYVLGLSMNGILAASHKFSGAFIMIYNIFVLTWTESICIHINDEDIQTYFNRIFNLVLGLFFSVGLIIVSVMPFVYDVLINYRYRAGYLLVPIHLMGSMFNVMLGLLGSIYIAKKDTKSIAIVSILSAIINLLVHLLLINYVGLYASPLSTLIALVTMSVMRNHDLSKKFFVIHYDIQRITVTLISWCIVIVTYYQKSNLYHVLGIFVTVIYTVIMSKDVIIKLLNQR